MYTENESESKMRGEQKESRAKKNRSHVTFHTRHIHIGRYGLSFLQQRLRASCPKTLVLGERYRALS